MAGLGLGCDHGGRLYKYGGLRGRFEGEVSRVRVGRVEVRVVVTEWWSSILKGWVTGWVVLIVFDVGSAGREYYT